MIRTFIFCDRCNPSGVRIIYNKDEPKRRYTDERYWFEGTIEEAKKEGWKIGQNSHTCPRCVKLLKMTTPNLYVV